MRVSLGLLAWMVVLIGSASAQPKLALTQEVLDQKVGVTTLASTRDVAVTLDGLFVYVATSGEEDDAVTVFARSMATGHLTLVEAEVEGVGGVVGLNGAIAIAISPDNAHVYVGGAAIVVFSRDQITGELTYESTTAFPDRVSAM